jgi:putative ABC transport system permease protein
MFGITWGVMALLLLGSIGEGFRQGQRKQMAQFRTDLVFIWGGRISSAASAGLTERWLQLSDEDCRVILRRCPLVRACSPVLNRFNLRAESPAHDVNPRVAGVWPSFAEIRYLPLAQGRFLNEGDVAEGRKVAVLGEQVFQQLFPGGRGVGQQIRLNQVPFDVIGRLAPIGKDGRGGPNTEIFVPVDAMLRYFPHFRAAVYPRAVNHLILQPVAPARHKEASEEARAILAERHGFDPKDRDAIDEWDTVAGVERVEKVFRAMDFFLGSVGLVTLALGSIGVMNIMLISVSERTHEIGVRKALGATSRDILVLFLLEGLTIGLLSGAAGLLLGWGISWGLRQAPMPEGFQPPTVTWPLGLLACAILGLVAVEAAAIPARRAALLPPAEAIRDEV